MNKVCLIGNLTKDPEAKVTPNNVSVTRFGLAVQRRFKNANGEYETDFISCVAWRGTADFIAKYFTKGSKIGVVGELRTRKYEKDGVTHYVTEVVAEEADFAGSKVQGRERVEEYTDVEELTEVFADDELPF